MKTRYYLTLLQLKLAADFSLEAWYYNETFAAWEPLMESEETLSGRRLWQLQLKVYLLLSSIVSKFSLRLRFVFNFLCWSFCI